MQLREPQLVCFQGFRVWRNRFSSVLFDIARNRAFCRNLTARLSGHVSLRRRERNRSLRYFATCSYSASIARQSPAVSQAGEASSRARIVSRSRASIVGVAGDRASTTACAM